MFTVIYLKTGQVQPYRQSAPISVIYSRHNSYIIAKTAFSAQNDGRCRVCLCKYRTKLKKSTARSYWSVYNCFKDITLHEMIRTQQPTSGSQMDKAYIYPKSFNHNFSICGALRSDHTEHVVGY